MINENVLTQAEKVILKLRSLYAEAGYSPYKMSKFEEYDFYVKNKDFLMSEDVITFNDTNGKLLALKPDVTLSIIKNCKNGSEDRIQRIYYNENVYRVSETTRAYREIMQTGLECFGEIGVLERVEVMRLQRTLYWKFRIWAYWEDFSGLPAEVMNSMRKSTAVSRERQHMKYREYAKNTVFREQVQRSL